MHPLLLPSYSPASVPFCSGMAHAFSQVSTTSLAHFQRRRPGALPCHLHNLALQECICQNDGAASPTPDWTCRGCPALLARWELWLQPNLETEIAEFDLSADMQVPCAFAAHAIGYGGGHEAIYPLLLQWINRTWPRKVTF